jgi:hypothetical protein
MSLCRALAASILLSRGLRGPSLFSTRSPRILRPTGERRSRLDLGVSLACLRHRRKIEMQTAARTRADRAVRVVSLAPGLIRERLVARL